MELIFTKAIGSWKAGEIRDYPKGVWTGIERSAGRKLETFTKPVDQAAKELVTKGTK